MDPKPWYTSKLIWAGILETVSSVLILGADFVSKGNLADPVAWMLFVSGVFTFISRKWFTDQPIA